MSSVETELLAIRHLVQYNMNPTDAQLQILSKRDPKELRCLIRRNIMLLLDPSVPGHRLAAKFQERQNILTPVPRSLPIPRFTPRSDGEEGMAVPPKCRGKKTPPKLDAPSSLLPIFAYTVAPGLVPSSCIPSIGSIAVLVSAESPPSLCRVIAERPRDGVRYFIVAFFEKGRQPGYVGPDFLYTLTTRDLVSAPISVDLLVTRLLSASQELVARNCGILLGADSPEYVRSECVMLQYVSYAALLLLCQFCGESEIPDDKLGVIIDTIAKAGPCRFDSTEKVTCDVKFHIGRLLK